MVSARDQQIALAIIPKVSSTLSLFGSGWIVVEVLVDKYKKERVYNRLLFAMSIYDILESGWNFASTWPMPRNTEGVFASIGSTQLCTAQGFFLQLGLAIPIYNAYLTLYYLLVLHFELSEAQLFRYVEPFMHFSAFAVGFGTALAATALDLFNEATLWCWIAPFPDGCKVGDDDYSACTRGKNADVYRFAFYFYPLWISMVLATIFILLVCRSVWLKDIAVRELALPSGESLEIGYNASAVSNASDANGEKTNNTKSSDASAAKPGVFSSIQSWVFCLPRARDTRAHDIGSQALWFTASFYMTHAFSTTNRILQETRGETYFPLLLLHSFFDPLQGFLNFLVYRRPRYKRHLERNPELSTIQAARRAARWSFAGPPKVSTPSQGPEVVLDANEQQEVPVPDDSGFTPRNYSDDVMDDLVELPNIVESSEFHLSFE